MSNGVPSFRTTFALFILTIAAAFSYAAPLGNNWGQPTLFDAASVFQTRPAEAAPVQEAGPLGQLTTSGARTGADRTGSNSVGSHAGSSDDA